MVTEPSTNTVTTFTSPVPVEADLLVATLSTEGEMVYQNEAWQNVFGPPSRPWTRLSDQEQGLAAQFTEQALNGKFVTAEVFLVRIPNWDQPLPVLLNFIPAQTPDANGVLRLKAVNITGEVLTEPTTWMTNQTERHRMETLGRMTMGIAHDFNNLLSGILGHTELLKRSGLKSVGPGGVEHLDTIEQAALDGASLVRKIQQYIRHERQTAFEPVNIGKIVQDSITLTKPYWYNEPRRQGISIDTSVDLREVPLINGSSSDLKDIFVNLILNAVQAMPHGGTISFRAEYTENQGVAVAVSDTGTGMTDRVRARIFEPLFTTKGKRGTGMGLAVCYGTVQEHDGEIDVETRLGFGTTFILRFPHLETTPVIETDSSEPDEGKSSRILIVDDEPMVRSVLTKLLSLKGHTVTEAASGAEALAICHNESFDLVFTDQGMPEMNGRILARKLRKMSPDLPIVLLTGDTEAGSPDSDVNLVLSKPFKLESLEMAIAELV
ncbi:MAG: response regulator [Rhodothermales bacterium]|nr:response regulator [Rhodothermales bacterium]